jgi:flagellar hook-basal body complex protein FliE
VEAPEEEEISKEDSRETIPEIETPVVAETPKRKYSISGVFLRYIGKRGRKKKITSTIEEVSREISQAMSNVFSPTTEIAMATTTTPNKEDAVGQLKGILEQAVGKLSQIQEETEKLKRKSISDSFDRSFEDLTVHELSVHEKELSEKLKEIQRAKVKELFLECAY